MESVRNFRIDGVELNWARLATPIKNPFNELEYQYELQIATTDPVKRAEIEANYIPMKEVKGKFVAGLKRKTKKQNGEDNGPVRVVNDDLTPFTDLTSIGNGSIGNVIVFQYPWSNGGRSGIGTSLTSVQITKLDIYKPSNTVDFVAVQSMAPSAADAEATLDAPF